MSSFESDSRKDFEERGELPKKLEISILKYFWETGIFSNKQKESLPRFLGGIDIFQNFSSNELRVLSKSLHLRSFSDGEKVFGKGDVGFGFYLIFRGQADVMHDGAMESPVVTLEKGDYFGELSLLQDNYQRDVTVRASGNLTLLGLLKPDLDSLIETYPRLAAKVLQSLSKIVVGRVFSLAQEVRLLKHKMELFERKKND